MLPKAPRAGVGGGILGHMGDSGGAARLSLVRSAEAGYDRPDVLSEEGGRLTRRGREQALIVATRLRDQEVHAVYGSPMTRAQETAEILGSVLAVPVTTLPGLEEPWVGDLDGAGFERGRAVYQRWLAGDLAVRWPGAETGQEVIARMTHALEYVAARHRGRSAIVVSHGGVMSLTLPRIARDSDNVRPPMTSGPPITVLRFAMVLPPPLMLGTKTSSHSAFSTAICRNSGRSDVHPAQDGAFARTQEFENGRARPL